MSREELSDHTVERLWRGMDERNWELVGSLPHDEFVCEWPQSRERIRGRDTFIAVKRNYPGDWSITIDDVIGAGERAASDVTVQIDGHDAPAVSFDEFRDGLIRRQLDYWPGPFSAPDWQAPCEKIMGGAGADEVNGGT